MNVSNCLLLIPWLVLFIGSPQEAQNQSAPAATTTASKVPVSDPDYKIGPQDILRIDVWKEPDISRTVPVRPDGKISLPLLNDVQAAGLTPMQLAAAIEDGFTKYITSPQLTVSVTKINTQRVSVLPAVTRPPPF